MSDAALIDAPLANATTDNHRPKVAVLVSGSGSNLQVLIDQIQSGALPIDIVGVISNVADAYAVTRAENAGIPVAVFSHTESGKRMTMATFQRHALAQFAAWGVELVILAGFMRILTADFIEQSPPMINLHPSLLPQYKGLDTHARVIATGDKAHGCSVHIVTPELDSGQVLTQVVLSVNPDDTPNSLQKRVQALEHRLLPWTVALIVAGALPLDSKTSTKQAPIMPLPWRILG